MDVWVCEYSPKQKAFHIDTLDRILAANRQTVAQGLAPGYVPLYAATTREDAHDFAAKWAEQLIADYEARRGT